MSARDVYGNLSQSQRSPKPGRRTDVAPSHIQPSKYISSSISQPVSTHGSPISSRAAAAGADVRRGRTSYGASRSSNVSPTLGVEPVPHSISSSAFNVGGGHHSGYYVDDLGSPNMEGRSGPQAGTGHHRSRSVTRVPLRNYHSLERDQDREFMPIREPRDRSLDQTDIGTRHPRSRERSLDRAGYREREDHYRDLDGQIEADPYRDSGHMSRNTHSSYSDSRHGYGRGSGDGFVMELQARLNDLQAQYSSIKRELEATTQKLGSSMHSIKTFWSPELKKERALRKEEAAKYALLNDQMKMLRSENQKQAALIRQMEEELRLSHMRNPDAEVQQHLEALYNEKEHMTKEIYLLRETIKELEMRIETQKQTLAARDESLKKLMEIKGVGGKLMEEERLEFERVKSKLIDSETRSRHLEAMLEARDRDSTKAGKSKIGVLEAILETKDSRINVLEGEIELLESKFISKENKETENNFEKIFPPHQYKDVPSMDILVQTVSSEVEELRIELNRRDQEIMAMGAKMKTLEEQHHDYQRHIAVLKESLCAKEEHYNMLQADVEELRVRLEEKNKLIEKKTQQAMSSSQERSRYTQEVQELRDHMEIKDRKINVLQRKIENLEDLLKEKDNQVDMARARLSAMQAHHSSSEGALSSLEEAISDKDKQISQIRDQRDRAEQDKAEERELHERDIAEYKMKIHGLESEMEKIQSDLQSLRQQKRPSVQQDSSMQAEVMSLRKDVEERQRKLDDVEKKFKQCAERLKQAETQQQQGGRNANVEKQLQELRDQLKKASDEKEKALKEAQKAKEDSTGMQNELERLLDLMTATEKEKFALNEEIQALQEALKDREAKFQASKRGQQTEQAKSTQAAEEAKRRESVAAKEAGKAQEKISEQLDRIEELEEALRESVFITAEREVAIEQRDMLITAAEEKMASLHSEVRALQKVHNARCTNCAPIKVKVSTLEEKLHKLVSERRQHLEDLFEMKQEALSAAISEKDSHLAVLEVRGIKNAKTAEEVDKLRAEKKKLVERIKSENENRVKLLLELGISPSESNGKCKEKEEEEESTKNESQDELWQST